MRYRITTPEPDFTGVSAGVNFTKGVAEIEAPPPLERLLDGKELTRTERVERDAVANDEAYRTVAYFRNAGYGIEELDEDGKPVESADEGGQEAPLPAKSASKADWVNAAVDRAVLAGEAEDKARAAAEALTKEQLIELLTPKGEHE